MSDAGQLGSSVGDDGHEALEFCRACRDEAEYGAAPVPAAFILWGKLLPPEALGPRCMRHAALYINTFRSGHWAAFDMHGLTRAPEVPTPARPVPPVPPVVPDSADEEASGSGVVPDKPALTLCAQHGGIGYCSPLCPAVTDDAATKIMAGAVALRAGFDSLEDVRPLELMLILLEDATAQLAALRSAGFLIVHHTKET